MSLAVGTWMWVNSPESVVRVWAYLVMDSRGRKELGLGSLEDRPENWWKPSWASGWEWSIQTGRMEDELSSLGHCPGQNHAGKCEAGHTLGSGESRKRFKNLKNWKEWRTSSREQPKGDSQESDVTGGSKQNSSHTHGELCDLRTSCWMRSHFLFLAKVF